MKRLLGITVLFSALLFVFTATSFAADVKKGIHIGDAGAFTGDAAAPCSIVHFQDCLLSLLSTGY